VDGIELQHLYRAMGFLGEELADQTQATAFAPRCTKDRIEEEIFFHRRDLFSGLDLVFFDTTSLYFEGTGGDSIGQRGFSKDHRPDLKQMVLGVILNDKGLPICCEMWPGNTADVKSLLPVVESIRNRFGIRSFCIVADRGMISTETLSQLESPQPPMSYILGARMRKLKAMAEVLSRAGRFREVHPEGKGSKDPSPLAVKQVVHNGDRYIVCFNPRQARKDAQQREQILAALGEQLKQGAKSLVGNKGFRRYLKIDRGAAHIDEAKVKAEARYDGKWVLRTNTDLSADQVALKYKQLWQVERVFRDVKSLLLTRPIFHQRDHTIRGHVFCSFLALVLRKELDRCLEQAGQRLEWAEIKQDLKALQTVTIEESGNRFAIRSQCQGVCGKVFQAVGVALPPTIREL
jgi:transposase